MIRVQMVLGSSSSPFGQQFSKEKRNKEELCIYSWGKLAMSYIQQWFFIKCVCECKVLISVFKSEGDNYDIFM